MEILILGGTVFLADELALLAEARGGRVTWIDAAPKDSTRAGAPERSSAAADPTDVEGHGRAFDVCIDQRTPAQAALQDWEAGLAERLGRYVRLSCDAAPAGDQGPAPDADPSALQAERTFGARAWCLRTPQLIAPADAANPFAWWLARAQRGGQLLCPAPEGQGVQWLDVRDLAAFLWLGIERECCGRLELGAPWQTTSLGEVIRACVDLAANRAHPVWADGSWLEEEARVSPGELPLWRPEGQPGARQRLDVHRAREAGLTHRPLAATLLDTQRGLEQRSAAVAPALGLEPAREARLLGAWAREHQSGRRILAGAEI